MKIWLNNLNEGDEFYHIILDEVYKCKHLGNANNPNYKMPRIKFKILGDSNLIKILNEAFGEEQEAFVNQYVYDNLEDARKALYDKLYKKLENISVEKNILVNKLHALEKEEEWYKKIIDNYDENNIKKDITES